MELLRPVELKVIQLNTDAYQQRGMLSYWIIHDHPSDFPDAFIARRYEARKGDTPLPSTDVLKGPTLEELRNSFVRIGMTRFERGSDDPPTVVEIWMQL